MPLIQAEITDEQAENIRLFMKEKGIKHFSNAMSEYIAHIEQAAKDHANAADLLAASFPGKTDHKPIDAVIARAVGKPYPRTPDVSYDR